MHCDFFHGFFLLLLPVLPPPPLLTLPPPLFSLLANAALLNSFSVVAMLPVFFCAVS
jgi:hypothetical protein